MVKSTERPPKPTTDMSGDSALTSKATQKPPLHRRVLTQPVQLLERRRSKSSGHQRSFSSLTSGEKKDSRFSSFRREISRNSSMKSRRSRSLPQSERSRKLHGRTTSSTDVLTPKNKTTSGKNFYVRVTLDSLSGITIRKGSKSKMKESKSPVIAGYASLLSSGHQLAVSMPFSVDHESSNSKLLWAGAEGERSRDKRQLHFSLQLQRERSISTRDDDSSTDDCKFHPKIVKMVIGLKCEDTKLPLGIATLVVNGKTTLAEDVDLVMRPMDETNEKKNKQRVPFFSSNKPEGISFSDDYFFSLSSSAILHAQVDTKADEIGKTKRQVWGTVDQHQVESRSKVEETRAAPEENDTTLRVADTKREPDHVPEEFMIPTPASPRIRRLKNEKAAIPPIEFVDITGGANSFTSDISSRRSIIENPCEMTSKLVSSCFGGFCGNAETLDEEINEMKLPEDKYVLSSGGVSTLAQAPPHSRPEVQVPQVMPVSPQIASFDMAQKSFDDLRDAQETLRRYANKTGVDVEDILDQGGSSPQYTTLQV